jgi:hypothetical protein
MHVPKIVKKHRWILLLLLGILDGAAAQTIPATEAPDTTHAPDVYSDFASRQRRDAFYHNFLINYIQKDLTQPLADSTEDDWADPFWGLELLGYKTPYVQDRITRVWDHISERSPAFQIAFLELVYTNYPGIFRRQVAAWMKGTANERIFAACAEYLLADPSDADARLLIRRALPPRLDTTRDITLDLLRRRLNHDGLPTLTPPVEDLLSPTFLPGQVLVFSFQRSNRDYPGLVIIRRADGTFLKNSDSTFWAVPELARSITNLPYYLHNGNTPQGIYLIDGFGHSQSRFLGPTLNIQLRMPYEITPGRFLKEDDRTDTTWDIEYYRKLLPQTWAQYFNVFGSFYAGMVGRREVIAHGTTIDPSYYKGRTWFPQTPSLGCLCASEQWDATGKRIQSDQQRIVDGLLSVGGADGYLIVIELDDQPRPVSLADVSPWMQVAGH